MLKYLFFTGGAGVQKGVRNETMNKRIIALGFLAKVLRAIPLRFPNRMKGHIMTESKVMVAGLANFSAGISSCLRSADFVL